MYQLNSYKEEYSQKYSTAIKQVEIDERRELNDGEIEQILMKYAKQREDAKAQFAKGGRDDLVAQEEAELEIVKSYLPKPLSDSELKEILEGIVSRVGASEMRDMGKVMGIARKEIGSGADSGRIAQFVKKILK